VSTSLIILLVQQYMFLAIGLNSRCKHISTKLIILLVQQYMFLTIGLTPSLEKDQYRVQNFKPLNVSVLFFALALERIFIETHSIESRCVIGAENVLFVGASLHFSARKFYRLGSEGVKQ